MGKKQLGIRLAEGALFIALLFGPVFFAEVWAQTTQDDFQLGLDAAAAGQFDQAVTHFLRARKAGSEHPALDYNLGVAYYMLDRYESAREAFLRLADQPGFVQLAYYNLGLVTNKVGDETAAVAWFQRAYADGSDANLKILSEQALQRLGAKPRKTLAPSKPKPWWGFVSTLLSHDSNVTLINDDLAGTTSESDNAFEVLAAADHWLHGGPSDGVQLSLSADTQMYATNSQYDFSLLHAGLSRHGRLASWRTGFGLSWDEIYFDGRQYQRVINAEADGRYTLSESKELRLRYRLSRIVVTDVQYDYLDGWRQQWRAGLWVRSGTWRHRTYYQLELNHRDDYTSPAGNFTSFSPTRHALLAAVTVPLSPKWSAGVDGRYRYSIYNIANDLAGGVQKIREDTQIRLGAQLTYAFVRNWEFEAGYSYTDNDSNIPDYAYQRSLVTAGVNWFF